VRTDDANQLSTVTDAIGGIYSYAYDAEGRRTGLALPNGMEIDYRYDGLDRLIGIRQSSASALLASYDYTLDPVGNRLRVTEADGSSIAWTYDDAYRLIGETRLDPVGSPTSGTTFAYDGRGNLTQTTAGGDVTAYSLDALDRLTGATLPDGTALAYAYDADGRRVRLSVDGVETNHLWDEASIFGDVVLETDASGAALASYVLGGPELLSQTRGGSTSYDLADAQGSTRVLTNGAAAVTDMYKYTPFGELFSSSGSTPNPYLFTGQQFDGVTGLYSLRARYYEPGLGRFLSRDPMGVQTFGPLELNRYVYAANNPVNLLDPTGRDSFVERLALGLVGGSAEASLARLAVFVAAPLLAATALLAMAETGALPYNPAFPDPWQGVRDLLDRVRRQGEKYVDVADVSIAILTATLSQLLTREQVDVRPRRPEEKQPKWVVRGGVSAPRSLVASYQPIVDLPGHFGLSVQFQPGKSVDELAEAGRFPNLQITYATFETLLAAAAPLGYFLVLYKTFGPGFHHDLEVVDLDSGHVVTLLPDNLADALSLPFARKPNPFPVP